MVEIRREKETDGGAVRQSRKSGIGKEVNEGVKGKKGREMAAACQASRLHGVLHGENGRKCWPPQLALSHHHHG